MKTKERKQYTSEFKVQAVALMESGKPVAQLAEELCMSSNLLYNWRLKVQKAQGGRAGARKPEARAPQRTPCASCGANMPCSKRRTSF